VGNPKVVKDLKVVDEPAWDLKKFYNLVGNLKVVKDLKVVAILRVEDEGEYKLF
jgi:hypothetical protein